MDNPVTVAEASMLVSKRCRTKAAVKGGQDAAMARVLNRRDSSSSSSSADKSTVVKKQQSMTHHRSSSSRNNSGTTTTMTITNTAAVSPYSTTTFDVVGEEDASVTAVVDPASLTAVSTRARTAMDIPLLPERNGSNPIRCLATSVTRD